jgi:hypothetical protein
MTALETSRARARSRLERSGVDGLDWTRQGSSVSLNGVPRKTAPAPMPPQTPLEYLAFEPVFGHAASAKLVWLFLLESGAGHYTLRGLGQSLGLNSGTVHTALKNLIAGDLVEGEISTGTAASFYRAKKPSVNIS